MLGWSRKTGLEMNLTNLISFTLDPVENGLESRIRESTLLPRLLVILKSAAHALWAVVEGVAKRLVNGLQTFAASHEDLHILVSRSCTQNHVNHADLQSSAARTRSKAVLHARGCVAMKTGFPDSIFSYAMVGLCRLEKC